MALSPPPRALLFDVFGTCVDWRTTVTTVLSHQAHFVLNAATSSLATTVRMRASSLTAEDWGRFAQQWRDSYMRFTRSIAQDESAPWKSVDEHYLSSLRELLQTWQLEGLWTDEETRTLSLIWHRLDPWSDAARGIEELNKLFYTCTLSNSNSGLLNDLKAYAKLEFTHVFGAEEFGTYKPHDRFYRGAVEKLGLQPGECALVAAHLYDLKAAKACGIRTIYVERPLEEDYSVEDVAKARQEGWVDLWLGADEEGFITVAERLGVDVNRERKRSVSH
ncbi:haloacid dehalogenase [Patellaria atrata CBS 101060]|uniref:Haloacid dehalogenase n=1 Tax=Patellaria atrata CBS 101060 TaxID=1346257 RepID=A0A9P4VP21_9PEZI|nr:haloacid dehalogenase [Patellaria atrata CBS 101060]